MPETTILDEAAVSEIEVRAKKYKSLADRAATPADTDVIRWFAKNVRALCATVKHLRERERTIAAVNADWLEERQQTIELAESLQSQLEHLRSERLEIQRTLASSVLDDPTEDDDPPYSSTELVEGVRFILKMKEAKVARVKDLQSQLEQLRAENEELRNQKWTAERAAWLDDPNPQPAIHAFTAGNERQIAYRVERLRDDLQSKLAQVEQELAEGKHLHAELKQIAQIGISEVSSVGAALKDNALIDFRSRAIQLCKDKAAEWEERARTPSVEYDNFRYAGRAKAATELAAEIEKL